MNIFGIGGPELIAILIIMLVFAGPKRMIHWSYIMGQYLAKFRVMWSQTVDVIQKEFDDAGVDIKIPKEPPTRHNFQKSLSNSFKPLTQPLEEALDEVKQDVDSVRAVSDDFKKTAKTTNNQISLKPSKKPSDKAKTPSLGTWGAATSTEPSQTPSNGNHVDMGTWSSPSTEE